MRAQEGSLIKSFPTPTKVESEKWYNEFLSITVITTEYFRYLIFDPNYLEWSRVARSS